MNHLALLGHPPRRVRPIARVRLELRKQTKRGT